jgi:hypothetical protein
MQPPDTSNQQTEYGTKTCICVWLYRVLFYFSQQDDRLVAVALLHVRTKFNFLKLFSLPIVHAGD